MKPILLRVLLCIALIFVSQITIVKGQSSPNVGQPTQPPPTPGAISGPTSVNQGQIANLATGSDERNQMYDWIVHLKSKNWVKVEDSRALLTAYLIAIKMYGFEGKVSVCCLINSVMFQEEWQN